MGSIMNLISETHHLCERREYAFNVLPEYSIITRKSHIIGGVSLNGLPMVRMIGHYCKLRQHHHGELILSHIIQTHTIILKD
jgi:hypothetical protein